MPKYVLQNKKKILIQKAEKLVIFFGLLVSNILLRRKIFVCSCVVVYIFIQPSNLSIFQMFPLCFSIPSIFMCKHSPMCFVMSRQKCVKTKQLHLTPFLIVPTTHYVLFSLLCVGLRPLLLYKTVLCSITIDTAGISRSFWGLRKGPKDTKVHLPTLF